VTPASGGSTDEEIERETIDIQNILSYTYPINQGDTELLKPSQERCFRDESSIVGFSVKIYYIRVTQI